jgi:hypothetical protein
MAKKDYIYDANGCVISEDLLEKVSREIDAHSKVSKNSIFIHYLELNYKDRMLFMNAMRYGYALSHITNLNEDY